MSLARRCLENENIRHCVLNGVCRMVHKEIATLCSDLVPSVLRDQRRLHTLVVGGAKY